MKTRQKTLTFVADFSKVYFGKEVFIAQFLTGLKDVAKKRKKNAAIAKLEDDSVVLKLTDDDSELYELKREIDNIAFVFGMMGAKISATVE